LKQTAKNGDKTTSFGGANKYYCKILEVWSHRSRGGWDVRGVEISLWSMFGTVCLIVMLEWFSGFS